MKTCSKCGFVGDDREFIKARYWCKKCMAAYAAKYRAENLEKARARNAKWNAEHAERMKAIYKKWRYENREKVNAFSAKYRAKNPEKRRVLITKWREKNRERVKDYNVIYRSKHQEYYAKLYFVNRIGANPTPELIALKVQHLALVREIKSKKKELSNG